MERANLDDYPTDNFEEYLSNDNTKTTTMTMEVTTNINHDSSHPPPSVTIAIKMEDEDNNNIEKERRKIRNQKCTEHRQRMAERYQDEAGESYDYSNNDLCNVLNIDRDAHTVIISKRQEREEAEAYSPSSNYRITEDYSRPARKWPNIKTHHSEAGPSTTAPQKNYGKRAALVQERFEQALHKHSQWHPSGGHSAFECRNLRRALGATLVINPHQKSDEQCQD